MNIPSKKPPFPPMNKGPIKKGPPGSPAMFPPPMMDTHNIKRKWLDVTYANQSPTQKLDIYLPETGDGPFPVVMVFHGGAWLFGDKGDMQQMPMMKGLDRGYAVACVNYRLSGESIFPAHIHDCRASIRYIRVNAGKYRLDPDKIAVWGPSAGGHLVALIGTSAETKEFEDPLSENAGVSCKVQAVVDWCGPAEDFIKMDEEFKISKMGTPNHSEEDSPESKLLGRKIMEVPELVRWASPMTYITADIPPFLIQHGELDQVVPVQQSINFAAELAHKAGKEKVTLEVLPGVRHHGDPAFETEENVQRVFEFIDACLKK